MLKIQLNSDTELVKKINEKLKETNGYCPCAIIRNESTKCPCQEFREQQTEGTCHCGRFVKINE